MKMIELKVKMLDEYFELLQSVQMMPDSIVLMSLLRIGLLIF
ncbi:TPA: hypothetical protein ACW5GX_001430 [Campylobacter coli]